MDFPSWLLHLNCLWNHNSKMSHTIYLTWLCHKVGTVCSVLTTVWKVNREDRFPLASCLNSILFLLEKMVLLFLPYHGRQPYPNTSLHKQRLKSQKTNCNLNSIKENHLRLVFFPYIRAKDLKGGRISKHIRERLWFYLNDVKSLDYLKTVKHALVRH